MPWILLERSLKRHTQHSTLYSQGTLTPPLHDNMKTNMTKKMKQFLKERNIHANTNTNTPNLYHHNGNDNAQIHYIFYLPTNTNAEKTHTHTHSTHRYIQYIHSIHQTTQRSQQNITVLKHQYRNKHKESNKPVPTFQKPRWTKCDKLLHKNTVVNLLKDANINTSTESYTILGLDISKLETILQHATELSIEGHQTHASKIK